MNPPQIESLNTSPNNMKERNAIMDNIYSLADIAAATGNENSNCYGGSWIWFLLIFVLLGWGNNNRGPMMNPDGVTNATLNDAINNQSLNAQLQQIALSSANNNYETAQLINSQNNTNLINSIQGFNNVLNQITNNTNVVGSKIDQLSSQMASCCCEIKTQMLNNQLDERNRQLVEAQNALNNAQQTQTILANLGRFVAWAGSGTATTGVSSV